MLNHIVTMPMVSTMERIATEERDQNTASTALVDRGLLVALLAETGACYNSGDHVRGAEIAQQIIDVAADHDPSLHVSGLCFLARHLIGRGDAETALPLCELGLTIARSHHDATGELSLMATLARAYHRVGLFREAFDLGLTTVETARHQGNREIESAALGSLAAHYLEMEDVLPARQLLNQSLAAAREVGDLRQIFWALNDGAHASGLLADQCNANGDTEGAQGHARDMQIALDEALVVARSADNKVHETWAIGNMTTVMLIRGDLENAAHQIDRYRRQAREHGVFRLVAYAALDEFRLLTARGQHRDAIAVLESEEHQQLLEKFHDLAIPSHDACYRAAKELGDFESALRHLEQRTAIERLRATHLAERQARILLARLDVERAVAAAEQATLDALRQHERAEALEQERDELHRTANEDSLTGLGNRRAADELLSAVLDQQAGDRRVVSVAFADLDHFKAVNDQHGHATGDSVLIATGRLMQTSLRPTDAVFRFGGEEFLLVFVGDDAHGAETCEQLRCEIETFDWSALGLDGHVTASFGVVTASAGESTTGLLARADQALYRAKERGRNCVVSA
jgi:diguanylate cyclase (GGDEF)-like protein